MEKTQQRSIVDAERDAEAAIEAFRKVMDSALPVNKGAVDHAAGTNAARSSAMEHIKAGAEHEESAAASREAARKSKEDGKPDESNEHQAEANVHDITAAHHQDVADTFHELHAHHAEEMAKGAGCDHAAVADMAKEVGAHHAAEAQKREMVAKAHDGLGAAATAAGNTDQAAHHAEMSKCATASMGKKQALAKRMTDLHTDCATKAQATKVAKAAAEAAVAAKVIPVTGLKKSPEGWVDVSGASFFGKRDLTDAERVDLVKKGHAMPDGSFPIGNKDDLGHAVKAIARAKEQEKVQIMIAKVAAAIGAVELLPAEWKKSIEIANAEPLPKVPAADATAGTADTASEAARQAATTAAGLDAGTEGVEKRKERIGKGMGLVCALAQMLEQVDAMQQSSAMEQLLEGDGDSAQPKRLGELCSEIASILRDMVSEETAELLSGDDTEVESALGSAPVLEAMARSAAAPWHKTVVDAIRTKAVASGTDAKKRVAMKKAAEAIERVSPKLQAINKSAAAATDDKALKAANDERDRAIKVADRMTSTLAAVAKQVAALNARVEKGEKENIALKAEIDRVGAQPLPFKGKTGAGNGIRKSDDGLGGQNGEQQDPLQKVSEAPIGEARTQALLDAGMSARERTLHGTGRT